MGRHILLFLVLVNIVFILMSRGLLMMILMDLLGVVGLLGFMTMTILWSCMALPGVGGLGLSVDSEVSG